MCTWSLLLTGWLGFGQVGLEPEVLTHWVTTTSFMGFHPIPRFRAYLGATTTKFAGMWVFLLRSLRLLARIFDWLRYTFDRHVVA